MKIMLLMMLMFQLILPASAMEFYAPEPEGATMPQATGSFSEGLWELVQRAVDAIRPELREGSRKMAALVAAAVMTGMVLSFSGAAKWAVTMAGTLAVGGILLSGTGSMIQLGAETVWQLRDYGKLLFPVITAAMAAQGGITGSAALYAGTAMFDAVLGSLLSNVLLPLVYAFLALAVAGAALEEGSLKRGKDLVKAFVSWCLKTLLMVFTTYMGITGVVSGTTDAAALKATKVTISSVVPVVGGVLSDASEAVLVSAAMAKNAAGIYGILAVLAIFVEPFVTIGVQYLMLKITASVCGLFCDKRMLDLMEDFSTAMGLILAMTGAMCLFLLISMTCFMKGVGL